MKHAARVRKSAVKYSRRPKIASKSPHRNILLSIFALIALVVGIYIFTSGTFTKNQASLKANALSPTTQITAKILKPADRAILTGLFNEGEFIATGSAPLNRFNFIVDDIFVGTQLADTGIIFPYVAPTPRPDGLYVGKAYYSRMYQTHYTQDSTWHKLVIQAIDVNNNYGESTPIWVFVQNGIQLGATPIPGYGPTGVTGASGIAPTLTQIPTLIPTPMPTSTPVPTSVPITNRLFNGGFEFDSDNNGFVDSWTSPKQFTRSDSFIKSGQYAGKHSSATKTSYYVSQNVVGIIPGRTYAFSAWSLIMSKMQGFSYVLDIVWVNSSNAVISTQNVATLTKLTKGWLQHTGNYVAPAGAASAEIRMKVTNLKGTFYVDDFVFL